MIKVSVITINLNNKTSLQKTFHSIFEQTFTAIEYIVIDGGSTDGSAALIKENADKINYWISEKDKGVYHAMNKGIQQATGEYVLFLNSGDHLINKTILEETGKELDGTGILYGNIFLVESKTISWTGVYPDKLSFQHFVDGSLPHPASFIKRSLFQEVGLYDERLQICADWKFFLAAVCRHQISYRHIDKTIATFYLDGLSSIGNSNEIIKKEKEQVFREDYPEWLEMQQELTKSTALNNNKFTRFFLAFAKWMGLNKFRGNTHA